MGFLLDTLEDFVVIAKEFELLKEAGIADVRV
jgi:hypothetical protein